MNKNPKNKWMLICGDPIPDSDYWRGRTISANQYRHTKAAATNFFSTREAAEREAAISNKGRIYKYYVKKYNPHKSSL